MAFDFLNTTGDNAGTLLPGTDDTGALRSGDTSLDPDTRASDAQHARNAQRLAQSDVPGDQDRAVQEANQIRDPELRITVYNAVTAGIDNTSIPAAEFQEFSVGMKDPMKLFFMMVFYLDSFTPNIRWDDVLDTATQVSGGQASFEPIVLPDSGGAPGGGGGNGNEFQQLLASQRESITREQNAQREQIEAETQRQRDALGELGVTASSALFDSGNNTQVWPFQNLPEVDGYSKDVDWPTDKQYSTIAEPIISHNKGGGPVETSLTFTYAVGLGGLSTTYDGKGVENDFWTVEQVMAMAYLAQSLIFPFESQKIGAADTEQDATETSKAQYPMVFMRHWQLFPFLTPFVVKSIEVTPDDDQPLLIDRPQNINNINAHLSIPACRQILTIKINLLSAHYYLAAFDLEATADQMQAQTSGNTYLQIAKQLLAGRSAT